MANLYIIIRAFLKHLLDNLSIFRLCYRELRMHILPKIRAFKSVPYISVMAVWDINSFQLQN